MSKSNVYNEEEILLQLVKGSEEAFEKVYHFYSARLYYKLLKLLKTGDLAEEVLQDVFITIWKNHENIDTGKSFCSYLFRIAANKGYDILRKVIREKEMHVQLLYLSQQQYSPVEHDLINKENSGILFQAIELLPPKRKLIFQLCRIEGKSYDEVSRQLGISLSTISDHIVKANQFIRSHILYHL